MTDNEFYSGFDIDEFSPHYLFYLGHKIVCAVMIDPEDATLHIYLRKYRFTWEFDFADIESPTPMSLGYITHQINAWHDKRHDHPLVVEALSLITQSLKDVHQAQ